MHIPPDNLISFFRLSVRSLQRKVETCRSLFGSFIATWMTGNSKKGGNQGTDGSELTGDTISLLEENQRNIDWERSSFSRNKPKKATPLAGIKETQCLGLMRDKMLFHDLYLHERWFGPCGFPVGNRPSLFIGENQLLCATFLKIFPKNNFWALGQIQQSVVTAHMIISFWSDSGMKNLSYITEISNPLSEW